MRPARHLPGPAPADAAPAALSSYRIGQRNERALESGFPALRTYHWAYTGIRDWTSYRAIDQLSTTRHVTSRYPPAFLSVGDADPFRSQAAELASVLTRHAVPLTTLFWNGTGDRLNHEYQFDFNLPQARTAFQRTLAFLATTTRG